MTMTRDERIERFRGMVKAYADIDHPEPTLHPADCQAVLDRLGELEGERDEALSLLAAIHADHDKFVAQVTPLLERIKSDVAALTESSRG